MRHKLEWQIFGALSMVAALSVALATVSAVLFWRDAGGIPPFVHRIGTFIVADLPREAPRAFQRELRQRASRLGASISIWDERGALVAQVGRSFGAPPDLEGKRGAFEYHTAWVALDDGRTMAFSFEDASHGPRLFPIVLLSLLGALVFGSHLAARRITRRLKLLEEGVRRFGQGDLDARVPLRGRDEIATLARAFNQSSARIAGLLTQQRRMLQSASHELRSPLARLRMAVELLADPGLGAEQREQLQIDSARDVVELDQLVEELLLAGRLSDNALPREFTDVALLDLLREEAARVGAEVHGPAITLVGNARMLRSLLRNLLENARRYGGEPIRAELSREGEYVQIAVEDGGPGIPEPERERIFEPFYRSPSHRETRDGGVGLGLALVKSIAEHHGGSVCYLPCAQGSRFEVKLKAA